MPTATGAKRQAKAASITVKKEILETMVKDFQCEACGHYQVRRTERESWYSCVNCGYGFGIEPYPRKHLRRATDAVGSGPISSH